MAHDGIRRFGFAVVMLAPGGLCPGHALADPKPHSASGHSHEGAHLDAYAGAHSHADAGPDGDPDARAHGHSHAPADPQQGGHGEARPERRAGEVPDR
jgi:hypothetical protein